MNLPFKVPKERNLNQWLEIATGGLVAPAKERIRMEIEAHYAEAVANHIAHKDVSQAYAEMTALAELGDANLAAKIFHERYLAESELSKLELLAKCFRSWPWLLFNYFFLCSYTTFFYRFRHGDHTAFILAVESTCLVVLTTALFIMARSQDTKSNMRLFVLTTLFYFGLIVASMLLRHEGSVGVPLVVIINFKPIFIFLRACYKSLRWKQAWPAIPPQDTALS